MVHGCCSSNDLRATILERQFVNFRTSFEKGCGNKLFEYNLTYFCNKKSCPLLSLRKNGGLKNFQNGFILMMLINRPCW